VRSPVSLHVMTYLHVNVERTQRGGRPASHDVVVDQRPPSGDWRPSNSCTKSSIKHDARDRHFVEEGLRIVVQRHTDNAVKPCMCDAVSFSFAWRRCSTREREVVTILDIGGPPVHETLSRIVTTKKTAIEDAECDRTYWNRTRQRGVLASPGHPPVEPGELTRYESGQDSSAATRFTDVKSDNLVIRHFERSLWSGAVRSYHVKRNSRRLRASGCSACRRRRCAGYGSAEHSNFYRRSGLRDHDRSSRLRFH